jgi:hypothetical protein
MFCLVIAAMTILGIVSGAGFNSYACAGELVSKKQRGPIIATLGVSLAIWTVSGSLIGTIPPLPIKSPANWW